MSIGNGKPWSDTNRFNQLGYSASTIFPVESNYENKEYYLIDLDNASYREENHNEWMDELRLEAAEEAYCDEYECNEEE